MTIIQSGRDKHVDQFFSVTLREDAPNLGDITEVKKAFLQT